MNKTILLVQGSGQLAGPNPGIFQDMKNHYAPFIKKICQQGEVLVVHFSDDIDYIHPFSSNEQDILSTFDVKPTGNGSNLDKVIEKVLVFTNEEQTNYQLYVIGGCLFKPDILEEAIKKAKHANIKVTFLEDFMIDSVFTNKLINAYKNSL